MAEKSSLTRWLRESYVTFVMNHGGILLGLVMSYPACLMPQLRNEGYYADTFTESLLGCIPMLMIGLSEIVLTLFIGKPGRKSVYQISLIGCLVGSTLMSLSTNVVFVAIGLVILSSGVSPMQSIQMTYISEVCQKEHRGAFLTLTYLGTGIGASVYFIFNSFLTWRLIAVIASFIAISGLLQSLTIPESSYWFVLQDNKDLAAASMFWFEPTLSREDVDQRIEAILLATDSNSVEGKNEKFLQAIRCLREKKCMKPLLVGILINFLRAGVGRPIIQTNVESIFRDVNFPYKLTDLIRWFGCMDLFGSFVVTPFVHKVRRKVLIHATSAILIACLANVVTYNSFQNVRNFLPNWLPVVSLCVFATGTRSPYMTILNVVVFEIQVAAFRPQIALLHAAVVSVFSSLYIFLFPYFERIMPIEYIFLYFMLNVLMNSVIVCLCTPETSKFEFYEHEKPKKVNSEM